MKDSGLRYWRIHSGFCLVLLFSQFLTFSSVASAGSGQLIVSPASVNFGNVAVGSSQTQTLTLANSGGPKITITQVSLSDPAFVLSGLSYPITLAGGQSVACVITFSPTALGSDAATLSIVVSSQSSGGKGHMNSQTSVTVAVSGTGVGLGQLAPSPTSLSFGNVATGSTSTLSETLSNVGGSALTIAQIAPSGSGFSFAGINPPVTLAANQSATFNVMFAPSAGGSVSGSLVISSNGSNPTLSLPLTGWGIAPGQLAITPSAMNFGNVVVGTTGSQQGTLTASSGPVTVSSASVSQADFSLTGVGLPATIPAGSSLPFSVVFAPQATGTASGTVSFFSNSSNSPAGEAVSGSGTPPPQHSVALTWAASTSTDVAGYNVYRGTVPGGPYTQINSALDPTTNETDSTVQGGQTYYYVVTAVNSTGQESAYSNQATAAIPYP